MILHKLLPWLPTHTTLSSTPPHSGADVRLFSSNGSTPLHEAARGGHHQVVELLVRKGADITALDDLDATPYDLAFRNNHTQVGGNVQGVPKEG